MTYRQKVISYALSLLTIMSIAACDDKLVFSAEKKIPNQQWTYADTLDFKVPVADTAQLYNLYIAFSHSDTFPNQNIYLKLSTRFPDGKRVSRVRSFDFFDIQGKPVGKCSGSGCETKVLLQDNLYFNQLGDYIITLEQFTRSNPISGINSIGLSMEKMDKKR